MVKVEIGDRGEEIVVLRCVSFINGVVVEFWWFLGDMFDVGEFYREVV